MIPSQTQPEHFNSGYLHRQIVSTYRKRISTRVKPDLYSNSLTLHAFNLHAPQGWGFGHIFGHGLVASSHGLVSGHTTDPGVPPSRVRVRVRVRVSVRVK